jgi:hypothetical protein
MNARARLSVLCALPFGGTALREELGVCGAAVRAWCSEALSLLRHELDPPYVSMKAMAQGHLVLERFLFSWNSSFTHIWR